MRAKKSLGQNFLIDDSAIERIIDALDLTSDDQVIEIGPGHGALTEKLIEKAGDVAAVEFDRDMVEVLERRFGSSDRFRLFPGDALTFDLGRIFSVDDPEKKIKLVANLPYNISTPILQRLIEQKALFSCLVLMFQREVVDRITAPAGGRDRGFLTVLVEEAFRAERLFDVPPGAFRPVPKVWSAVVRLTPVDSEIPDKQAFRRLVSTAFAQRRKTILNNLKAYIPRAEDMLRSADIEPNRRAETLTFAEWKKLAEAASSR